MAAGVIEAKGASIIASRLFKPGLMDYSEHLAAIKEPILKMLDRRVAVADSTDSVFYEKGVLKDRYKWELSIDGFFVPGYIDEVINILPQIPFNYITTTPLGSNEWIVSEIINDKLTRYTDGAYFIPDQFFVDRNLPEYKRFSKEYESQYGAQPDMMSQQGYDAAALVMDGIAQNALTPELMKNYLSRVSDYRGISGVISFDSDGANTQTRIYRINRREAVKVK